MSEAPLAGVRVLDFGGYIAGPLVGMLLADQGAEVIKIDPPGGPRFDHPVNAILNRGKACCTANLNDPIDRARIAELLRGADIVVENFSATGRAQLQLGAEDVHVLNSDAIHLSLPGTHEEDHLLGDAKAFEGVIAAATAQFTNIHPARQLFGLDPVYTALPLASVYAGVHGATAVVLALRQRRQGGGGAAIEVPLANAAISAMSSLHLAIQRQPDRYATPRLPAPMRRIVLPLLRQWARTGGAKAQAKLLAVARGSYPALMNSYICGDGRQLYLFAIDNAKLARAALERLGILDMLLAEGLSFADPYAAGDRRDNLGEASNLSRKWQTRLKELIGARLLTRPAAEWEAALNEQGVTCAVQRTTAEWLALSELHASGIVVQVDDPMLGKTFQPGQQVKIVGSETTSPQVAPRRAVKDLAMLTWSGRSFEPTRTTEPASSVPIGEWLRGVTVVDMTSMVAGPVAGRTLAEYGARVVKVDTPKPNHGPRLTCWYGIDVNQGKESILIDLKMLQGHDAMRRLMGTADVLLTNHAPIAMAAMGLDGADIKALKPALIQCRIGAYNGPQDGPWARRPGYDPVLQAASGIMTRYGDPGRPELHAIASCVDALTGYSAAFGMALALLNLPRDGQALTVETSLAAAATLIQLPYAIDYGCQRWSEASGQRATGEHALYRLYHARDGWLFVAGLNGDPTALLGALELEAAADDEALAARMGDRLLNLRVDRAIAWLSGVGLAAVRVQTVAALAPVLTARSGRSVHLTARNIEGLGRVVVAPGQQAWSAGALADLSPAEKPGASTELVLRTLGLDADALFASGAAAPQIIQDYLPS